MILVINSMQIVPDLIVEGARSCFKRIWDGRTEEQGDVQRRLCEEPLMGAQLSGIPEASGALDCCVSFWVYWASGSGYLN
ncbi:DNA mismatch repair mutS [Gossypium arboreum]|uniref:DNA mismatch repair mutS n=1 Tax=Gossypium arboreum TaxID=29729 RepID=A0A0B0MZK5_GOSAR|nr:DNA mismatch repair mutS [Gossypium arboreum]